MTITSMLGLAAGSGSHAFAHPALWLEMALSYPWLLVLTNGVRLVTTVLALAILVLWMPSCVRYLFDRHSEAIARRLARMPAGLALLAQLLHPPRDGDGRRAGYLPLAIATLIFQARWFFVGLTELIRARMAFAGQVGILVALAFGIYAHGRVHRELSLRRALLAYTLMLLAAIGASAVMGAPAVMR